MKRFLQKSLLLVAIIFLTFGVYYTSNSNINKISGITVHANEQVNKDKKEDKEENKVKKKDTCETYGEGTDDYYQCVADRKASVVTSDFITGAIYSLDSVIKGKEITAKNDYIINFSNSAQTAIAYEIDIADPQTILMHLIGIVIALVEAIGSMITVIVMIVYNAATSSFWQETIRSIFTVFDDLVFKWDNPNSIFMKFVFLFTMIAIIQKLVKSFKLVLTPKKILQIIGSVLCSVALVIFVARYGKPIMDQVETMSNDFLGTTVSDLTQELSPDSSQDYQGYEIETKKMIFEVLQAQGFRLRHFGVTDVNQIHAPTSDYDPDLGEKLSGNVKKEQKQVQNEWKQNSSKQQQERYRKLLQNPSKDNAQRERKIYGSTNIVYSFGQSINVLMLSIVYFIHRTLIAIVIGGASLLVFGISLMKEILLSVSVYALAKCIISPERHSAFSWFINRFAWMMISLFSKVTLMFVIYLITSIVSKIGSSAVGMLAILAVDAILVCGMVYLVKNAPKILQKLVNTFHADGSGLINGIVRFATGHDSPKQILNNFKDNFKKDNKNLNDDDKEKDGENIDKQDDSSEHAQLATTKGESEEQTNTENNETIDTESATREENQKENDKINQSFDEIETDDSIKEEKQKDVSVTDTNQKQDDTSSHENELTNSDTLENEDTLHDHEDLLIHENKNSNESTEQKSEPSSTTKGEDERSDDEKMKEKELKDLSMTEPSLEKNDIQEKKVVESKKDQILENTEEIHEQSNGDKLKKEKSLNHVSVTDTNETKVNKEFFDDYDWDDLLKWSDNENI